MTPLHIAILKLSVESIGKMIDHGADMDIKNRDGSTALHIACKRGRLDVVRELMERGANSREFNHAR